MSILIRFIIVQFCLVLVSVRWLFNNKIVFAIFSSTISIDYTFRFGVLELFLTHHCWFSFLSILFCPFYYSFVGGDVGRVWVAAGRGRDRTVGPRGTAADGLYAGGRTEMIFPPFQSPPGWRLFVTVETAAAAAAAATTTTAERNIGVHYRRRRSPPSPHPRGAGLEIIIRGTSDKSENLIIFIERWLDFHQKKKKRKK